MESVRRLLALHEPARGRIAGLDALRGVAVIAVLLFHTARWAPSGFLGVDVFFVLSGFLITGLLQEEFATTATVGLRRFSIRRLLRLYPALAVMVLFVLAVALATHESIADTVHDAIAALTYTANTSLHGALLSHTWTLAIEEQFYLVWPMLFVLSHRRRQFRPWLGLALVAAVILADATSGRTGVLHTFVRATGLPLGCALALSPKLRTSVGRAATPAAVGLVVCFFVSLSPALTTRGPVSIGALLAVPVVAGLKNDTFSLPAARALRWVGLRSYSLYLWHFPVTSVVLHHLASHAPSPIRFGMAITGSFAAAEFSYRFVERPGLNLRDRLTSQRVASS